MVLHVIKTSRNVQADFYANWLITIFRCSDLSNTERCVLSCNSSVYFFPWAMHWMSVQCYFWSHLLLASVGCPVKFVGGKNKQTNKSSFLISFFVVYKLMMQFRLGMSYECEYLGNLVFMFLTDMMSICLD